MNTINQSILVQKTETEKQRINIFFYKKQYKKKNCIKKTDSGDRSRAQSQWTVAPLGRLPRSLQETGAKPDAIDYDTF